MAKPGIVNSKAHRYLKDEVPTTKGSNPHGGKRSEGPKVVHLGQHKMSGYDKGQGSDPGPFNPSPKRAGHERSINRTNKRK